MEIFVDDETKLTLHGLQQYYVKLKDNEKNRKLFDLLDVLEFNQVSPHRSLWGPYVKGPKKHHISIQIKVLVLKIMLDTCDRHSVILEMVHTSALGTVLQLMCITGGDLCEVCAALHCFGSAAGGAELSCHCYSQSNASRRKVRNTLYGVRPLKLWDFF